MIKQQDQDQETYLGDSMHSDKFFSTQQTPSPFEPFITDLETKASTAKGNILNLAILIGYTYEGKGIRGEGLRKNGDLSVKSELQPLKIVQESCEQMEGFLTKQGYSCYPLINQYIREADLKHSGRKIRNSLTKLSHKYPQLRISLICFFSGHGSVCKLTGSQVLYQNDGKYLRFEDFMILLINSNAGQIDSKMQFIGFFHCCRTILTTERSQLEFQKYYEQMNNNHQTIKATLSNCVNFALIYSCRRSLTTPASLEMIQKFIDGYNFELPFDRNANNMNFYSEVYRYTPNQPLLLIAPGTLLSKIANTVVNFISILFQEEKFKALVQDNYFSYASVLKEKKKLISQAEQLQEDVEKEQNQKAKLNDNTQDVELQESFEKTLKKNNALKQKILESIKKIPIYGGNGLNDYFLKVKEIFLKDEENILVDEKQNSIQKVIINEEFKRDEDELQSLITQEMVNEEINRGDDDYKYLGKVTNLTLDDDFSRDEEEQLSIITNKMIDKGIQTDDQEQKSLLETKDTFKKDIQKEDEEQKSLWETIETIDKDIQTEDEELKSLWETKDKIDREIQRDDEEQKSPRKIKETIEEENQRDAEMQKSPWKIKQKIDEDNQRDDEEQKSQRRLTRNDIDKLSRLQKIDLLEQIIDELRIYTFVTEEIYENKQTQARVYKNGKYYCGGPLEVECLCLTETCLPDKDNKGCNCQSCQKLDFAKRKKENSIRQGEYVNYDNHISQLGKQGNFFCGIKLFIKGKGYVFCKEKKDENCKACQCIGFQYKPIFGDN